MEKPQRAHDPEGSAVLFIWFLAALLIGGVLWIASSRLHLTTDQLTELSLLTLLGGWTVFDIVGYYKKRPAKIAAMWPPIKPRIDANTDAQLVERAETNASTFLGYEPNANPVFWSKEKRTWQTITSGQSGSGKTTLLESILQQDIKSGVPIIFFDGKGERKFLDKILPYVEAAGRMADFRLIDPGQPEESVAFNPFWAPNGNPDEHSGHVFESFKVDGGDDFFDQHQKVYLENIARVLHYTEKRFNFYDVLVAAYDAKQLRELMKVALDKARLSQTVTRQQRLNLEMSIQNLLATFEDKERVSKIQGLINHLMTFMSDSLATITGPYDNLLTIEDVLDQKLILYVNLNINVNSAAVTSLGRIILQNLQLALGRLYAETSYGTDHQFVSVLLDEFAPFAYSNFSRILQTARGANVGFMFALQSYGQLDPVGFGLKDSLTGGPNNSFMLRMKDDNTTSQFRRESGEVKQDRISVRVEKGGLLAGDKFEEQGSGNKSEYYDTRVRDEQLKALPTGQMQVLMSDRDLGLVHKHVHIRKPFEHFIKADGNNLYPAMESRMSESGGLNLRFPELELEAKRTDRGGKRPMRDGRKK
jgi:hypothetical protein